MQERTNKERWMERRTRSNKENRTKDDENTGGKDICSTQEWIEGRHTSTLERKEEKVN